jgi:predicted AlkP superfamily phosphohydrolase/phosphomutase
MFNFLKKRKKDRNVVVIGLDGVPYTLLVDYMERGIMPELSQLCKTGKLSRMKSTLPEVSSVAWSSFMTGKNPGEHGIFGFMEIDKQSYDYTFPNFSSLKAQPIWVRDDIKAVAFNIPQTYPAKQMNGVTPLHSASHNGELELSKLLINNGAEINVITDDGKTPLFMALEKEFCDTADFIINRGGQI